MRHHDGARGWQVSLDCNDPEAAVFACHLNGGGDLGSDMQQGRYSQQGYAQQGYSQQGYAEDLPAGWTTGIDPSSGSTYYYNEQTGQSQWEPPLQGGYLGSLQGGYPGPQRGVGY
jgi:hypothetical protein